MENAKTYQERRNTFMETYAGDPILTKRIPEIAAELIEQGMSVNEAAKQTAKQTGFKKSDIYKSLQNG